MRFVVASLSFFIWVFMDALSSHDSSDGSAMPRPHAAVMPAEGAKTSVPPAPVLSAKEIGPVCLVTGGAGYLGSKIVQRLVAAGCEVRSLDVAAQAARPGVLAIKADLQDAAALQKACVGVDTVFHTAALISILSTYRKAVKERVFGVNVQGTRHLLAAAAQAGVQAFVHTSSFNVALHPNPSGDKQDERSPYATGKKDLYTMSKIAAEKAVLAANSAAGMRTCALRPGGIWGGDVDVIMIKSFLTQLAAGKFTVLVGAAQGKIDNTHVENLVDAQLLAARALRDKSHAASGQAYNITDDETINGMEWFRPLAEGLGYAFPSKYLANGLMIPVAALMEFLHYLGAPEPLLTTRGLRNLSDQSCLSIAKAQRDLGYRVRYQRSNGMPQLLVAARPFVNALQSA